MCMCVHVCVRVCVCVCAAMSNEDAQEHTLRSSSARIHIVYYHDVEIYPLGIVVKFMCMRTPLC